MITTAGMKWPRRQLRGSPPFLLPARHVDGSCQPDEACGENCLTDSQGCARQAGQLDQQARRQRVGKERQGFDRPAGQRLVPQDLIEVEGDGHECQPEQGARSASKRGGEVVPLFGVVWHRGDPPVAGVQILAAVKRGMLPGWPYALFESSQSKAAVQNTMGAMPSRLGGGEHDE
jgi:hypothetical protein